MTTQITYLKGDATEPVGEGNKLIIHVCNDIGGWGSGFVLAVSGKWELPEREYRRWACSLNTHNTSHAAPFRVGQCQVVRVENGIWVVNMIAQRGIRTVDGIPPVRYDAIKKCLGTVARKAKELDASVHAPMFGAGLAGGDWDKIETIIKDALCSEGIDVTVYEFD